MLRLERADQPGGLNALFRGQQLGLQLVVDQWVETARVMCGDQINVAIVHADHAECLEPLGRYDHAAQALSPNALKRRSSSRR